MPKLADLTPKAQAAALAVHREAMQRDDDPTFLREILEYLGIRKTGSRAAPAGICPTCSGQISVSRATNPRTGSHRGYCSDECVPA